MTIYEKVFMARLKARPFKDIRKSYRVLVSPLERGSDSFSSVSPGLTRLLQNSFARYAGFDPSHLCPQLALWATLYRAFHALFRACWGALGLGLPNSWATWCMGASSAPAGGGVGPIS
jgi:hypothetical protein